MTNFGLPSAQTLKSYRIWDSYFTPAHAHPGRDGSSAVIADVQRSQCAIELGQFERLCYFAHVGIGTTTDPELEQKLAQDPSIALAPLQRWPDRLLGMIQLNANNVPASRDAIDRWVRDGPMLGVYFPGSGPGALCCTDRNIDPLIERIAACGGVIMQHTWFKTGGKQGPGESTPSELVELAGRYPEQSFLCALRRRRMGKRDSRGKWSAQYPDRNLRLRCHGGVHGDGGQRTGVRTDRVRQPPTVAFAGNGVIQGHRSKYCRSRQASNSRRKLSQAAAANHAIERDAVVGRWWPMKDPARSYRAKDLNPGTCRRPIHGLKPVERLIVKSIALAVVPRPRARSRRSRCCQARSPSGLDRIGRFLPCRRHRDLVCVFG